MVRSINDLGKILEQGLVYESDSLAKLGFLVKSYQGTDWNRYWKSNECTYTELDAYYGKRMKITVATWLPGQYGVLNKSPDTKCWVKILRGSLEASPDQEEPQDRISLLDGNLLWVEGVCRVFRNTSEDTAISLQVYCPYTVVECS